MPPLLIPASAAVLALASLVALANLGRWVSASDAEPERVNIIFTFAAERERYQFSRDMLLRHPEARWIISSGGTQYHAEHLEGIDPARVTVIPPCSSTWDEVNALAGLLRRQEIPHHAAVVLVSCPYHLRRIRIAAWKLGVHRFPGMRAVVGVPVEYYGFAGDFYGRGWWRREMARRFVMKEVAAITVYFFRKVDV